ncbi:CG8134 [Drosophila busckii]|uniref:CG8134 n=2 Tax=Drosophila busckii TaxID=30019 RepID=A0A0M4EZH3_DROBS|nr:CG8134 [Drosophila busckii]
MDKLRGSSNAAGSGQTSEQQIDHYPKNFIEQYLRASTKIKKIERVVFFKRFAPNVADVQAEFQRLAYKFEESGIMQYAAMCHIGFAKCESFNGAAQRESEAYVRAARGFLKAHNEFRQLHLRSGQNGFREGALHCYHKAAERVADTGVFKAAVLRELQQLERQLERTSSFASPAHQINELELNADLSIQRADYRGGLQQLDDIVDNIYERRAPLMYEELLRRVEVLRLLLLVHLNLPPARQSPAHIKLIEYYYTLAQFETPLSPRTPRKGYSNEPVEKPGAFVPQEQQSVLAEIICCWVERKMCDLKHLMHSFDLEFSSISQSERQLLKTIHAELSKNY